MDFEPEHYLGEHINDDDLVQHPATGEWMKRAHVAILFPDTYQEILADKKDLHDINVRLSRPTKPDMRMGVINADQNGSGQTVSQRVVGEDRLRNSLTITNHANVAGFTNGVLYVANKDIFKSGQTNLGQGSGFCLIPSGGTRDFGTTGELWVYSPTLNVLFDIVIERFEREDYDDSSAVAR